MTTIHRIRKLAAMGFVMAAGAYLHVGVGEQLARAQAKAPGGLVGFGPNHETEQAGGGVITSTVVPQFGIGPVLPGPAHPHSRSEPNFLPYSNDPRNFYSVLYADSAAYAVSGGMGNGVFGGIGNGVFGGFGNGVFGGFGNGGLGYPGMGGASSMYGSSGWPGSGLGMSLPPQPELQGTYRAGNQIPDSTVGGVGNPANPAAPAAGNAGPSEDAFDNAATGRPSPTRQVRSNRAKAARRSTVRKHTPRPSAKVEARGADAVPTHPEEPRAQPQQADIPQEKPAALKSEENKPAPRRSMLGSPR